MGLVLKSDALRGIPFQDRLLCSYAEARPLQRKLWLSSTPRTFEASRLCRKVMCTLDDAIDQPIEPPQYYIFDDPISGKPEPAYATNRNNIPDPTFWAPDMPGIVRRSQSNRPSKSSSKKKGDSQGGKPGSRRRTSSKTANESTSQQSVQVLDLAEEEDEDEYRNDFVAYKVSEVKEPEKPKPKELKPLPDDKLWFNWRKIPPEQEPWHEFSRPPTDAFAVMATAAAKRGQIKLFSDKPTVAETVLARARKDALMQERLDMETKRREEIGAVAYYSEWVKAWTKDTSKEAVQKHYEETGEDESIQLMNMFEHQTFEEYRIMMGTDPRIQRDPLCMRMTPEEKKAVWGGDPVYPTINYYQDPNEKADYRGPNLHEPHENLLDALRENGRLMTKEQLKKIQDQEAASQYAMEKDIEDAIAGAVDIGEKEEEDGEEHEGKEKEDGEEDVEDEDEEDEEGNEGNEEYGEGEEGDVGQEQEVEGQKNDETDSEEIKKQEP